MPSDNNTLKIYKSSAGSGKTTTLVFEYLKLILPDPEKYSRILAITFTNKAANEMKQRIINFLTDLNRPGFSDDKLPGDMKEELTHKLNAANINIQTQAGICLKKILHSYSDFAVSTIDSFVYRIIRSFAKDLNLSWDFDVELETEDLFRQIIDMLMENFGKDKFMTRQIMSLVEDKLNEGKSWRIEYEILEMSRTLLESDTHPEFIDYILEVDNQQIEKLRKQFRKENKELLTKAKHIAQKAKQLVENNGISTDDLYHGKNGLGGYIASIASSNPEKVFEEKNRPEQAINDRCLYSKNKPEHIKEKLDAITDQFIEDYEELRQIRAHAANYFGREAIYRNLYILAILKNIKENYESIKEENALLPISEFARSIAQVTLSEDIPYIYERLGERYQHFFIDEFQDTSTLQWKNLLPLIENALSQNNFNLIVGDVKQAIYRFRGGNIEQLAKMPYPPDDINDTLSLKRYEAIQHNAKIDQLNVNYRSKKEIIEFNNRFFTFVKEQMDEHQQQYYDEVTQDHSLSSSGGLVQISLEEKEDHMDKTLEIINNLREEGYSLSDIAVLCRKNKEAQDVAVYLMANTTTNPQTGESEPIRVISDESLTLKQSAAVNTLISFARLLETPEDTVQLGNILQYAYLHQRPAKNFHSWYKSVTQNNSKDFDRIFQNIGYNINTQLLLTYDLYNFFESLVHSMNMNGLNNPYLQFFFDEVLNFTSNKKVPTLFEFLKCWDQKGKNKSIISPEGTNAIQVKTIHKSKGLDFPVVIYPYALEESSNGKNSDYKWVDTSSLSSGNLKSGIVKVSRNLLEPSCFSETYINETRAQKLDMINTLYVCMTRPKERLYIISSYEEKSEKAPLKSLKHLFSSYFDYLNIKENKLLYPEEPTQSKATPNDNEDKKHKALHFQYTRNNNWQKNLTIKKPQTKNIIEQDDPKVAGTIIHTFLAQIFHEEDLPEIKKQVSLQIQDQSKAREIKQTLDKVVKHPELNTYFKQQEDQSIFNEVEILSENKLLRPDRIIVNSQHITVIDYKSGEYDPGHEQQISEYAESLKKMYNRKVNKFIVYISDHVTVKPIESRGK